MAGIFRSRWWALFCAALALALGWAGAARAATTWTVNTTSDVAPTVSECSNAANDCSIRQAIDKAASGDTIDIPAGTYQLTLRSTQTGGGALDIHKSLTIDGTGSDPSDVVIKPGTGFDDRLIHITSTPTVLLHNLSLDNGFQSQVNGDTDGSPAIKKDGGETTLDTVILDHDVSNLESGAIHNVAGDLILENDTFSNDQAFSGGGLRTDAGTVSISSSTFASDQNNGGEGGAIYVTGGSLVMGNSTVVDSGFGSAIGGGIANNGGAVSIDESTLNGNTRGSIETESGTTSVQRSIVDTCVPSGQSTINSTTTQDPITNDLGDNIYGDSSCPANGDGDKTGALDLAPLADNSGKTETEAVLFGSTVLTVDASGCASSDQRGVSRPSGQCTPGAFQAVLIGDPTASTDPATSVGDTSATLHGTINLDGEAGAYHFIWGTSPSSLTNSTPDVGAGVVSSDKSVSQDLTGLTPHDTYYFKVVADNASADTTAPDPPQQFTVSPLTANGVTAQAAPHVQFSGLVATFTDANPGDTPSDFTATIDWGDGSSQSTGTVAANSSGGFTVSGSHTYASTGSKSVTVTIDDTDGSHATAHSTIQVATPPSTGKGTLSGAVSQLLPYMPGHARAQPAVAAGTEVRFTIGAGKGQSQKSTRTAAGGAFRFTGLPRCQQSLGQTCTVAVLGKSGAVEAQKTVQLGPGPSDTVVYLVSGQVPDRYLVTGDVLEPGASAPSAASDAVTADLVGPGGKPSPVPEPRPTPQPGPGGTNPGTTPPPTPSGSSGFVTDLTISTNPGGKGPGSYDAATTCGHGGWATATCPGGYGGYLLDLVRVNSGGDTKGSSPPVITLWEKNKAGALVAVDSAKLKLPADTAANRAEPPTTVAPDLHELDPAPSSSSGRSITGHVTKLEPSLPGMNNRQPADGNTEVNLVSDNGKGGDGGVGNVLRHVKTDSQGRYVFTNVTDCRRAGEHCSVEVRGKNGIEDVQPVSLGELSPSVTVVNLQAGRVSDRFMISGSLTGPMDRTDLTVSLLDKHGKPGKPIYDAVKSCGHGGWSGASGGAGSCHSTVGAYLLGFVPPTENGIDRGKDGAKPHRAVLTLLQHGAPVDSLRITLPADSKQHNENPPVLEVGPLHTLATVPGKPGGRSLFGRVTAFKPNLPGVTPSNAAVSNAQVSLQIRTGKDSVDKHTRTDRQGYYSFSDLPTCSGSKATCTVEVLGKLTDKRWFKLSKRTPSATEIDLQAGRINDRFVVIGNVLAPPFAGSARPSPPVTDLVITGDKGQLLYDAQKACHKAGWAGGLKSCISTVGSYALGFVPTSGNNRPETVTVTLYEGKAAVDSAQITLPADTPKNRDEPPTITAPDLQG